MLSLKNLIINKPGSVCLYNSPTTFMLSAIVQKVSGEKVINYLKTRFFEPLNIEEMDWEINPQGIDTGGWGRRLKTEDNDKASISFHNIFSKNNN